MTTLGHFWEGRDSAGREVRAYLVTEARNFVSADTRLPAILFRARTEWSRDPGYLEVLRTTYADINDARARAAARAGKSTFKLKRAPRAKGVVWSPCAVVPLDEFVRTRQFATPLGLEPKFRPNMARLGGGQLGEIAVGLDAWLESGGERSIAKELRRPEVSP